MPSSAHLVFDGNINSVMMLEAMHGFFRSPDQKKAGRPPEWTRVLLESALVTLTSCWEAYIEDVAVEAFEFLIANADSPDRLPAAPRRLVASRLEGDKHDLKVWDLAGDGWRRVMEEHRDEVLQRSTGSLNTPKVGPVDELVEDLIGLPKLSSNWHWPNMTTAEARKIVNEMVTRRGDLAHRGPGATKVLKWHIDRYGNHVTRVANISDSTIGAHFQKLTQKAPW